MCEILEKARILRNLETKNRLIAPMSLLKQITKDIIIKLGLILII